VISFIYGLIDAITISSFGSGSIENKQGLPAKIRRRCKSPQQRQSDQQGERDRPDLAQCDPVERIAGRSRLRTNLLTKENDISLGALREALSQLSAEGLTQAEAHRGYLVTLISVEDVVDPARVRTVVETPCLIWAIENGTLEWVSNIDAATHRLVDAARELDQEARPSTWTGAHAAYHAALVGSCGSLRLPQVRKNLHEQSERYRRPELSIAHDRNADSEHRLLAEATIARDTPMPRA
jgi:DNA-binding GntR family transcriptional regulator